MIFSDEILDSFLAGQRKIYYQKKSHAIRFYGGQHPCSDILQSFIGNYNQPVSRIREVKWVFERFRKYSYVLRIFRIHLADTVHYLSVNALANMAQYSRFEFLWIWRITPSHFSLISMEGGQIWPLLKIELMELQKLSQKWLFRRNEENKSCRRIDFDWKGDTSQLYDKNWRFVVGIRYEPYPFPNALHEQQIWRLRGLSTTFWKHKMCMIVNQELLKKFKATG